tara:strand:+ start:152 stop:370 length:219 start_codon:yes stop_codon:yes gene_type:complete
VFEIEGLTGRTTGNKGYYPRKVVEMNKDEEAVLYTLAIIAVLIIAIVCMLSEPPVPKPDPIETHFMRVETHR